MSKGKVHLSAYIAPGSNYGLPACKPNDVPLWVRPRYSNEPNVSSDPSQVTCKHCLLIIEKEEQGK